MATYDPQPLWKRNLAGILDFILSATVFATLLFQLFPDHRPVAADVYFGRSQTILLQLIERRLSARERIKRDAENCLKAFDDRQAAHIFDHQNTVPITVICHTD